MENILETMENINDNFIQVAKIAARIKGEDIITIYNDNHYVIHLPEGSLVYQIAIRPLSNKVCLQYRVLDGKTFESFELQQFPVVYQEMVYKQLVRHLNITETDVKLNKADELCYKELQDKLREVSNYICNTLNIPRWDALQMALSNAAFDYVKKYWEDEEAGCN